MITLPGLDLAARASAHPRAGEPPRFAVRWPVVSSSFRRTANLRNHFGSLRGRPVQRWVSRGSEPPGDGGGGDSALARALKAALEIETEEEKPAVKIWQGQTDWASTPKEKEAEPLRRRPVTQSRERLKRDGRGGKARGTRSWSCQSTRGVPRDRATVYAWLCLAVTRALRSSSASTKRKFAARHRCSITNLSVKEEEETTKHC
jgi:hypothetical protein